MIDALQRKVSGRSSFCKGQGHEVFTKIQTSEGKFKEIFHLILHLQINWAISYLRFRGFLEKSEHNFDLYPFFKKK